MQQILRTFIHESVAVDPIVTLLPPYLLLCRVEKRLHSQVAPQIEVTAIKVRKICSTIHLATKQRLFSADESGGDSNSRTSATDVVVCRGPRDVLREFDICLRPDR